LKLLVTGGAGFIGSALARYLNNGTTDEVFNLGKPTYGRHLESLGCVGHSPR
jgi:dTDP-glucose 4,6-dehydratase